MRLADKIATMARRGGGSVVVQWMDDYMYGNSGELVAAAGRSATLTKIPIASSSNIEIYTVAGVGTGRLIELDANGDFITYKAMSSSGLRSYSMSASTRFILITCNSDTKLESYVKYTDGDFIVKDGLLLVSTEGGVLNA